MPKKVLKKKPKKLVQRTAAEQKLFREIWVLCYFGLAFFVFVCHQYPEMTGLVGSTLTYSTQALFGLQAAYYLPLFLVLAGVSNMVSTNRPRVIFSCIFGSFLSFVMLIEIFNHSVITSLSFPVVPKTGGYIGSVGMFFLDKALGQYGTLILIACVFLVSFILLLGVSIQTLIKQLLILVNNVSFPNPVKFFLPPKVKHKTTRDSLIRKLVYSIFYRRVVEYTTTLPSFGTAKQLKRTNKKEPISAETVAFDMPDFNLKTDKKQPEPKREETQESQQTEINQQIFEAKKVKMTTPPKQDINSSFQLPPISLLQVSNKKPKNAAQTSKENTERAKVLEMALSSFNVDARVVNITTGPSVTRFELQPGDGVKISRITNLSKDIALKLAAPDIRIEAPIPGKALVGIEVPNLDVDMVTMRTIIDQTDFYAKESKLVSIMGLTISGESILMDVSKMPHVLIAGATGAGKSVCINSIIISILMRATPEEVKFLMIDPKKVELNLYEGIPHLVAPVVTDPQKAAATLKKWALLEMERRYQEFSDVGVKDISGYNAYIETEKKKQEKNPSEDPPALDKLPYIVVVIDELADLMMVASQDVEQTICRLAQMSRATGIHLIIATQRPSVNVVTGLIKANVPSRVSFFLQSQIDSRTILDMPGAEKLMGKGDMLYSPVGSFKPKRVQGVFVSESEVKQVVGWLKKQGKPSYIDEIIDVEPLKEESTKKAVSDTDDPMYEEAKNLIINTKYASTSYLQRKLRIGYNRAARLMDALTEEGIISEYVGEKKSRQVV